MSPERRDQHPKEEAKEASKEGPLGLQQCGNAKSVPGNLTTRAKVKVATRTSTVGQSMSGHQEPNRM